MKLVREEAESASLGRWLADRAGVPAVSSELGRVEVLCAARRVSAHAVAEAHAVIADLDLVPLDRAVTDVAIDLGAPLLRTLDALHLASAMLLGDELTAFVAYDHRLAAAAEAASLPAVAPAADDA